ncbi:uncharacterized protein LOC111269562 isoform X2 [Varroa jacobsoni]|nr:uncharacterized protein LOC111269562 isoform X2 [Varroa jacobsoni]XP_022704979.1 uncharacterized protein LOC111269562 isoform X2 [Varroa jacobsoni]XP_022704980.1 uncharacterized protein LOC111269562 isoform X2 [Varroa jacobsoni]
MEATAAMRVCCPSPPPETSAFTSSTSSPLSNDTDGNSTTTNNSILISPSTSYPGKTHTPQLTPSLAADSDRGPLLLSTRPRLHSLPVRLQYSIDTPANSLPSTRRASDWLSDVTAENAQWLNQVANDFGNTCNASSSSSSSIVDKQGLLCPPPSSSLTEEGADSPLGKRPSALQAAVAGGNNSASDPALASFVAAAGSVALPKRQQASVTIAIVDDDNRDFEGDDKNSTNKNYCEAFWRNAGTPPPEQLQQQHGTGSHSKESNSSVQQQQQQQHPLNTQNYHIHPSDGNQQRPQQDQPLQQRPHPELQQQQQDRHLSTGLRRLSSHKSADYPTEQTSAVLSESAVQATHTQQRQQHQNHHRRHHHELRHSLSEEQARSGSVSFAPTPGSRHLNSGAAGGVATIVGSRYTVRRSSSGAVLLNRENLQSGVGQQRSQSLNLGGIAVADNSYGEEQQQQQQQQQQQAVNPVQTQVHHSQQQQNGYRSTFKPEWTLKWPYIVRSASGDPHVFFCEICKKTVSCAHQGLRDVTRHLESSGHHTMNFKISLPTMATEHPDLLTASLSLQALRDSGELSVVTTPPHEHDSDDQKSDVASMGPPASPPPVAHAPLQATQAIAAANGRLNPALKDVQCPICLKVFSRKFSLEMHYLIHQNLKPYTCQHCGRSFRQKGTLMRHKAIHSQTPSYRCGLCHRSYRQKNVFLHHLRNRHKISTDMLDRRRSKSGGQDDLTTGAGSPSSLLDGSGSPGAAAETVYPPPELGSPAGTIPTRPVSTEPVTSTPPGLAGLPVFSNSQLAQLPPTSTRLQNPLFLPGLFSSPLMQTPLGFPTQPPSQSSMSPQNSWHCPFCPYETLNNDTDGCRKHLFQHIQESPYSCLACGKRCFNEKELILHIQEAHGPATNPVGLGSVATLQAAINNCYRSAIAEPNDEQNEPLSLSRVVKEEPSLSNGCHNNASKEMAFTCIPCKVDFSSEEDLENHIKSHHVQPSCTIDDSSSAATEIGTSVQVPEDLSANSSRKRSFDSSCDSSSDSAPSHKPLHKSDDSDSCDPSHRSAKEHAEAHTGKQPKRQFLCVDCNKVFNSKHVYRYHVQMHISVTKSFRCGVCKIGFAKKHDLLQHTRQTHMKKFACAKCNKLFSYRSIYQRHEQDCDGQVFCRNDDLIPTRCRTRSFDEGQSQKAGSLPLIDVSLASSALGRDLIGVIPLLGDENQQGCPKQSVLLGVPVINPSVLQTHQQLIQNLLVVRNMA